MNSTKPTSITADRQTASLKIEWNDGHMSRYPFPLVRAACPCAECRGGHANMRSTPDETVFEVELVDSSGTRIKNIEAVGAYAITIEWEDGHHYGIYNWHYLRELCPCLICRPG